MYKKYLLATLCCALTSPLFASITPYAGFALVLNNTWWTLENPISGKTNFNGNGEALKFFGGVNSLLTSSISMGAEAFISDSSTQTGTRSLDDSGLSATARETYSYGISILPGYLVTTDTTMFTRFGIVRTHFKFKANPGGSANDTVTGGQAGIGLALALSKNLDLRGEYTYNFYQTYDALNYSIASNGSQLSVAFAYKFV
jgi:opacity protein-like surface antigen